MTRYVVSHEYGHLAFYWSRKQLGYASHEDHVLEAEYMRIREGAGFDTRSKGDGERWHRLASEVIANDFRVLVMGVECEFWPHEVAAPKLGSRVDSWWRAAIEHAHKHPDETPIVEVAR
jgi:hypothetical protein